MTRVLRPIVCVWLGFSTASLATVPQAGEKILLQDLILTIPPGWYLRQNARDRETLILGFANGERYVTLFVQRTVIAEIVQKLTADVDGEVVSFSLSRDGTTWEVLHTSKTLETQKIFTTSFYSARSDYVYYGYASGPDPEQPTVDIEAFLTAIQ